MEMTDTSAAIVDAHRKNFERYRQLLAMDLTRSELEYIHRRIAETRLALDQIELGQLAVPAEALAGSSRPPEPPMAGTGADSHCDAASVRSQPV
jgi:hypothetical protein